MTATDKLVETALFTVLDADVQSADAGSLGQLGATGVHRSKAPQDATEPFLEYSLTDWSDAYTLAQRSHETMLYDVVATDVGESAQRAQDLVARVDELLTDQAITVTGRTLLNARRAGGFSLPEEVAGSTYQRIGATFRIEVSA